MLQKLGLFVPPIAWKYTAPKIFILPPNHSTNALSLSLGKGLFKETTNHRGHGERLFAGSRLQLEPAFYKT